MRNRTELGACLLDASLTDPGLPYQPTLGKRVGPQPRHFMSIPNTGFMILYENQYGSGRYSSVGEKTFARIIIDNAKKDNVTAGTLTDIDQGRALLAVPNGQQGAEFWKKTLQEFGYTEIQDEILIDALASFYQEATNHSRIKEILNFTRGKDYHPLDNNHVVNQLIKAVNR